jgi:hypothetical protein
VIPDVAPALHLDFDKEEESPIQEILRDRSTLPPKHASRSNLMAKKSTSSTGPSPAAAVALAATSKVSSTSPEAQSKYHQNARLTVKQASELMKLCSHEIKTRGLATLGIFRPFRATESMQQQERLVELFLMYIDPETYEGAFSNSEVVGGSTLLKDGFGRIDVHTEFKRRLSYANINDVVSLLKWGLRRLRMQPADLKSFSQYTWYEDFVDKEKDWKYPATAYSDLLLPNLPAETQVLLDTVLDLMSSISAHHIANAMSASKICKILGFWLFGRVGIDHPPQNLRGLVEAWETSARIAEHLLLAYIRDQATRIHLMPSRLMKIVQDYPNIGLALKHKQLSINTPCLSTRHTALPIRALFVEIQSENIIVSSLRPRSPRDTLRAALNADANSLEASEEMGDWIALADVASKASSRIPVSQSLYDMTDIKKSDEDRIISRQESALFSEEDARVMQVVSSEFERRRARNDGSMKPMPSTSLNHSTSLSGFGGNGGLNEKVRKSRFSEQNSKALFGMSASSSSPVITTSPLPDVGSPSRPPMGRPKKSSLRPQPSLTHMQSTPTEEKLDWNLFASDGFERLNEESNVDQLDLQLNQAFKLDERKEERSSMKRPASSSALRSKRSNASGSEAQETILQAPSYTLQKISLMALDETFIVFWQDQLLDDCIAARLPYMVVANLNKLTAGRLIGPDGTGTSSSCTKLLLISETVIPPRPPMPRSSSTRPGKSNGTMRRRNTTTTTVDEEKNEAEKRSLFAPSIRSNWSAGLSKTKDGLKRVGSMLNVRK